MLIELERPDPEKTGLFGMEETELKHLNEPDPGLFVAESPNVIYRALKAGYEPLAALIVKGQETGDAAKVLPLLSGIPVYLVPEPVFVEITGFRMIRGLLCLMKRKTKVLFPDLAAGRKRLAVLEEVTNPTNVGAAIRSAAALGMDAVVMTAGCADPLYRRAARVSMGTCFQIPWCILPKKVKGGFKLDLNRILHDQGFKTCAMALKEDSMLLTDPVLSRTEKLAVLLGNEGAGLKDSTLAGCDYTVMIPMYHGVDSLNVAAASALAFYELGKGSAMAMEAVPAASPIA